ncbi:MAG: glycosyltransferase family 2 protein [Bacteroidales bacterium]|jgi:GT2 family glycosyltransferase
MQLKIAIIVPVHNELESTKRFVSSYYDAIDRASAKGHCSLFIVDDGSTDGTSEWLTQFHPEIKILHGDGGLWWSGSINLALKHIIDKPFTHFLLFNNDNIVDSSFFLNLSKAIDEIGNNKIITSKIINIYPQEHIGNGGVVFDRKKVKYISNTDSEKRAIVNTAGGMGVFIPLEIINKIGFFDAVNFPQKSGDTDFYLRADRAGMQVNYYPSMKVYNDNSISGFSGNSTFRGLIQAYSFPKGYMNPRVDLKLFMAHGNHWWAIYRVVKNNIIFIIVGLVRIAKTFFKKLFR